MQVLYTGAEHAQTNCGSAQETYLQEMYGVECGGATHEEGSENYQLEELLKLEELRLLGHHGARIKAAFHKAEPTLKKIGGGLKKAWNNPTV